MILRISKRVRTYEKESIPVLLEFQNFGHSDRKALSISNLCISVIHVASMNNAWVIAQKVVHLCRIIDVPNEEQ